ncbi:MAG: 3-methylornithyl-N6-L-lysine dehydrogenase PylD [Candidatus Methanoplasma sp.]|jgi:pyrrolysine biosynthesis protein PylD|nr:3-methylornithyl-N6-L-lysine dehydrogenase PylD [Candidatus Methanoplasma sp.]
MTRLTDEMVRGVIGSADAVDSMLSAATGMNRLELALDALGLAPGDADPRGVKASAVPVTSGLGVIKKFSESVAEVAGKLGMDASVTRSPDVTGFSEALSSGSEVIFMADDETFMAYNVRAGRCANNSFCTAAGYASALKGAAGGLGGKRVLVIGAGRVGSIAARIMSAQGAEVCIADIDSERAERVAREAGASVSGVMEAVASHDLILNASPAHIPGSAIRPGSIISSPGIPHTFDAEARSKATIIHDPLDIGTSVMAVQCVSFSRRG